MFELFLKIKDFRMGIGEEIDEILAHAPHSRLVCLDSFDSFQTFSNPFSSATSVLIKRPFGSVMNARYPEVKEKAQ